MEWKVTTVAWDADLALSFERNLRPVIVTGEARSRFGQQFSIVAKGIDGESDDSVIAVLHGERDANEALAVISMEATDSDVFGCARNNEDFRHNLSFRGDSTAATIAEGGAATSPVLNSRDRTAGGPF